MPTNITFPVDIFTTLVTGATAAMSNVRLNKAETDAVVAYDVIKERTGTWDAATNQVLYKRGSGASIVELNTWNVAAISKIEVLQADGENYEIITDSFEFNAKRQSISRKDTDTALEGDDDGLIFPLPETGVLYPLEGTNLKITCIRGWADDDALDAQWPDFRYKWAQLTAELTKNNIKDIYGRSNAQSRFFQLFNDLFPTRYDKMVFGGRG